MKYRALLIPFILFTQIVFAQKNGMSVQSPAAWVKVMQTNYAPVVNANDVADGYFYLLSDNQKNVEEQTTYAHYALKIVSEAGVQNASQISIDYDPEYEQLFLHTVELVRDGKHINKLNLSKFKTLQRETDLERNIYDGTYTAVLIMEDVRKGDVIEYSFSTKGRNPVFSQKFSNWFYTQYSVPLGEYNHRIICDASRKLNIKDYNESLKATIETLGGKTSYTWHTVNRKPLPADDNMPQWFDAYGYTMVSEFQNWKEVKKWAKGLFVLNEPLSKELKDSVESIKKRYPEVDKQVMAVVRMVQNEVRYMGIEMGVYSHLPNRANKVFSQRFGDCKDKSQLLCTILRVMGVEAHPVLINTTQKDELPKTLPNPASFNHCTVQIKMKGKNYWIDPTISYQCGDLESNAYPDHRWGLVVTDNSDGLTAIKPAKKGRIRVTETFDISDFEGPANLTVNSIYEGEDADDIRYQIANSSISELEDNYKNFYARLYPKIRMRDSLKLVDYPDLNKYTITEYYAIDNFWVDLDSVSHGDKIKADFEALFMESYIHLPKTRIRKMPIGLKHPVNIHQTIEIKLPEAWGSDDEQGTLTTSAFDYKYDYKYSNKNNTFFLNYDYVTKNDFVPVEETEEYIKTMDQIYDHVTYTLTYDKTIAATEEEDGSGKTNWSLVAFLLFYAVVIGYVFYRLYFINIGPEPDHSALESPPVPMPLGGWLILPLIGLFLRPFGYVVTLFTSNYFNADTLRSLSDKNGYWTLAYVYETVGIFTVLCFTVFILILFLKSRNSLPRLYIIFSLFCAVYNIFDIMIVALLLEENILESTGTVTGSIVACAIWIPYFLSSERVKNTFVVRYRSKHGTK